MKLTEFLIEGHFHPGPKYLDSTSLVFPTTGYIMFILAQPETFVLVVFWQHVYFLGNRCLPLSFDHTYRHVSVTVKQNMFNLDLILSQNALIFKTMGDKNLQKMKPILGPRPRYLCAHPTWTICSRGTWVKRYGRDPGKCSCQHAQNLHRAWVPWIYSPLSIHQSLRYMVNSPEVSLFKPYSSTTQVLMVYIEIYI